MRRLSIVLIALFLTGSWAADNPPADSPAVVDPESTSEEQQGAGDQATAEDEAADEEEDSPGRFIPTEEISQDLGVSFPVDI